MLFFIMVLVRLSMLLLWLIEEAIKITHLLTSSAVVAKSAPKKISSILHHSNSTTIVNQVILSGIRVIKQRKN